MTKLAVNHWFNPGLIRSRFELEFIVKTRLTSQDQTYKNKTLLYIFLYDTQFIAQFIFYNRQ